MYEIIVRKDYQSDYDGQVVEIGHLAEAKAAIIQLMDIFLGYGDGVVMSIKKVPESLDADGD